MARARNIKPSLFKNEILGTADPLLTILFAGLWCLADRDGRLEDRPLRIKAEIFPYRELDINGYLTELAQCDFILRYESDGNRIIQVVKFAEHQNPHKTERPSQLPVFSDSCRLTVIAPLNNGTSRADSLLLIPDSKKEEAPDEASVSDSVWTELIRVLVEQGSKELTARKKLGVLMKVHGKEKTEACWLDIQDRVMEAAEPFAYFAAALKNYKLAPKETALPIMNATQLHEKQMAEIFKYHPVRELIVD